MYTQFFGNYLLNNGYITSEQLISALEAQHNSFVKLGVLAIHSGFMTSSQVESVHIAQTHDNRKFGEIAIEKGYLTNEQVETLLTTQTPDYLLFSQTLNDLGHMTTSEFEKAFKDYQTKYALCENDFAHVENSKLVELIHAYYNISRDDLSHYFAQYLALLFNNLIRFIGKDFTPHAAEKIEKLPEGHCAMQKITGSMSSTVYYISDNDTLLSFASRYAQEEFPEIDELVEASVEDFLNLHNGLFLTTMSNEFSIELNLEPPYTTSEVELNPDKDYYVLPITFSFGKISFVFERERPKE